LFNSLALLVVRKRKLTLFTFILVVLVAGGIGSLSFSKLESGGYSDPKSDSAKAAIYLTDTFHIKDPGVVLVLDAGRDINDPQVIASATSLESLIKKEPGVSQTLSYWSAGSAPNLKSADGKAGFLFIYADKSDFGGISEIGSRIQAK
jgi:RND superfamily putative drug exporter